MEDKQNHDIYVCSDSVGETAEAVVRATIRQFKAYQITIKRHGQLSSEDEIVQIVKEVQRSGGFIAYTLVLPELREMMKKESIRLGVRAVDIMGPMMQGFIDTFHDHPVSQAGLLHKMDEDYFKRVDAVEFAVKYDDGRDARGILQAEIVLIGISRTSKTPLSIFLAHKGIKTANLPLMPEVKPPQELFQIPKQRIIGLTMNAEQVVRIRKERLKSMGLGHSGKYATLSRVVEEIELADELMKRLGCSVVDVTDKAIEETAGTIIEIIRG